MHWKKSKEGDVRVRRVFAWLPIETDDGTVYWLERVKLTEKFVKVYTFPEIIREEFGWNGTYLKWKVRKRESE
jgi:hypothetical protein